jgi:transketolase
MTTEAGSGYLSSCLSCAEIIAVLFFEVMRWDPADPDARDVDAFVLSKGHAAPILWAGLLEAGASGLDESSLRSGQGLSVARPTAANPWIKLATASLGQGLAAASGIALANRLDGIEARIFCLMGDGECAEGSVWEAAQLAADNRLDRLTAIVDVNGLQAGGPAPGRGDTAVLAGRFAAFGWQVREVDGHDVGQLLEALRAGTGAPTAILARTVKGKGVSFLQGAADWHGKTLDEEQMEAALRELGEPPPGRPVEARRVPARAPRSGAGFSPIPLAYGMGEQISTAKAFGDALTKLGERLPELVVMDADATEAAGTAAFAAAFPDRFFEANIAEQAMVGAALGLAVSGKIPCIGAPAAYLTRAYDFIRAAALSPPAHLVICGSQAGVSSGRDGASDLGLEDVAMFRALDGATILCPSDAVSAERLTELAMRSAGMVYLRTSQAPTPVIYESSQELEVGGSKVLAWSELDDLTLVAAGATVREAVQAYHRLLERGVRARVIDAYSVKPLDVLTLQRAAEETGTILVVEDHSMHGGLGDAVSSQVGRLGRVFRLGVTGRQAGGSADELMARHRLSSEAIEREVLAFLEAAA